MNKFVNVDLLQKEIRKECDGCIYQNTRECLSCRVPDFEALVDIVYEQQERNKRFAKRGKKEK